MSLQDASGLNQFRQQLRTATSTGQRNAALLETLRESLDDVRETTTTELGGLREEIEELGSLAEQQVGVATAAISAAAAAAASGVESSLPKASDDLDGASEQTKTSLESDRGRIETANEGLQEGSTTLLAAIETARGDGDGAAGELTTFTEALRQAIESVEEIVVAALQQTGEAIDGATAPIRDGATAELQQAMEAALIDLQTQAAECEAAASRLDTQVTQTYGEWAAAGEETRTSILEAVLDAVEETANRIAQAVEAELDRPLDELQQGALPAAGDEIDGILSTASEWQSEPDEVRTAADALDRAESAKQRFVAASEGR